MKQESVKAFAQAILKRPGGLHILVNNAGLGYCKKSFTDEGVGMLTQVGGLRMPELAATALHKVLVCVRALAATALHNTTQAVRICALMHCGFVVVLLHVVCMTFMRDSPAQVSLVILDHCAVQVNHLGPYTLTRMLEPKLIASKARLVNVVSVTHRLDKIRCARHGASPTTAICTGAVVIDR